MKTRQTYIRDDAAVTAALDELDAAKREPDDTSWADDLPEVTELPSDEEDSTALLFPPSR